MRLDKVKSISGLRINILLAVVLVGIFWMFLGTKEGMHLDEFYTFTLANTELQEGTIESVVHPYRWMSGKELYDEMLNVNQNTKYDFSNVYENQANDVHPPLYYFMVNIISSITYNGQNLMQIGVFLNLLIAMVIYVYLIKLIHLFVRDYKKAGILSFLFCCSMGFINCLLYIRMYMLLMLFSVILMYLLLKYEPKKQQTYRFYISLFVVSVLGLLTQYYFVILLALSCFVYGILLIIRKKFLPLVYGILTVVSAIGVVYAVYPAIYTHIFCGYRGKESMQNAMSSSIITLFHRFFAFLNNQIFGGMIMILLIGVVIMAYWKKAEGAAAIKEEYERFLLLSIPAAITLVIVAKIAPYQSERYVFNVYFAFFLTVFLMIYKIAVVNLKRPFVATVLIIMICVSSSYGYTISNQRKGEGAKVEALSEFNQKGAVCIYVYKPSRTYTVLPSLTFLKAFDRVIFIPETDMDTLKQSEYANNKDVVLFVNYELDTNKYINEIKKNNNLKKSKHFMNHWYAKVFHIQ